MFKCPKCGNEKLRFVASLIFSAPIENYHNLPKAAMRSSEFIVWGVDWGKRNISCPQCGWMDISPLLREPNYTMQQALHTIVELGGPAAEIAQQVLEEVENA